MSFCFGVGVRFGVFCGLGFVILGKGLNYGRGGWGWVIGVSIVEFMSLEIGGLCMCYLVCNRRLYIFNICIKVIVKFKL